LKKNHQANTYQEQLEEAKNCRLAGDFSKAISVLKNLQAILGPDQRWEQIATLNELSRCLWHKGQPTKAIDRAQEALELAEQTPPILAGRATALSNLGFGYWQQGKLNRAKDYFQQSFALFKEIDNPQEMARSLNNLGCICCQHGELNQAEELLQQSLNMRKKLDNPQDTARSLHYMALVYLQRGEIDLAEEFLIQSMALFVEIDNPQDIASSMNNLGELYRQQGKLDKSEQFLKRSLALKERVGNPQSIAETLYQLMQTFLMRDRLEDAGTHADQLFELAKTIDMPDIAVKYHLAAGMLRQKQHDFASALNHAEEAKTLAEEISHFELQIKALQLLIQILLQMYLVGEQEEYMIRTEALLLNLEKLSKQGHLHGTYVESIFIRGLVRQAVFDLKGATGHFQRAELLAEERGIRTVAQRAHQELKKLRQQVLKLQNLQKVSPHAYEQVQLREVLAYLQQVRGQRGLLEA